jgi:hypothetical protein
LPLKTTVQTYVALLGQHLVMSLEMMRRKLVQKCMKKWRK